MNRFFLLLIVVLLSGCGVEKWGDPSPTDPSASSGTVGMRSLVGSWTGTETATVGESGTLAATFTAAPTDSDTAVSVTLRWTNERITRTYAGLAHGPLSDLVIVAADYACGYTAEGVTAPDGTVIKGTYHGTDGGAAFCAQKAGTFVLTKR
jgi:hypothetical protein